MPAEDLPNIPPANGSVAPAKHNFNVTLSDQTYAELGDIAKLQSLTKVQVIRGLIQRAHMMFIHNVPVCVTGSRCFSPQLHPPPQTAPHQTLIPKP